MDTRQGELKDEKAIGSAGMSKEEIAREVQKTGE